MLAEKRKCIVLDAILFLLKHKPLDRFKITKMLAIADADHKAQYGRAITNDRYIATIFGPAGELALEILSFNTNKGMLRLPDRIYKTCEEHIDFSGNTYIGKNLDSYPFKYLSNTDKKVLLQTLQRFGNVTSGELVRYIKNQSDSQSTSPGGRKCLYNLLTARK